MTDQCQYLEYRPLSGTGSSEEGGDSDGAGSQEPRAYCTAADTFVQAMRADVCNLRYGLDPETDCEFYRDAEGLPAASPGEGAEAEFDAGGESGAGNTGGASDTGGDRG
ncbi:hypothetical protein [Halorussus sp. AFM4]|uniref:hypothetical protein n=1 Tax=Halorussus sp. AFM4 TaxID=3421651 RepID=UPI003EC04621